VKNQLSEIFPGLNARDFIQDVLGVTEIIENGVELIHSCRLPFGMHKNGDRNPSASLNFETLLFNCFTCGGGSIIWLVQNCLDISREEAINILKNEVTGLKTVPVEKFLEKLDKLFTEEKEARVDIPVYNEKILNRWVSVTDYLTSRGVSTEVQREMRTGIERNRPEIVRTIAGSTIREIDRIILPHFVNGRLVGWVARKTENIDGVAKYKNSKGFPRQYSLYNQDNVRRGTNVYVVESPMSVLVLKSRGINNVVATFGAKINAPQLEILRNFEQVTVFMDGDAPGRSGAQLLVDGLKHYTNLRVIDTPDNEDPASLDYVPEDVSSFVYELSKVS